MPFGGTVASGFSVLGEAFELLVDLDVTASEEALGTVNATPQFLQAARRPA